MDNQVYTVADEWAWEHLFPVIVIKILYTIAHHQHCSSYITVDFDATNTEIKVILSKLVSNLYK